MLGPRSLAAVGLVAALGCESVVACGEIDPGECQDAPLLSFDELHASILAPSCGEGISCHVADDRPAADIRFDDVDLAYATLTDPTRALVVPGAPHCGGMIQRIESTDPFWRMPPAVPLDPAARCAIIAWIRAGAPR